jgi:molecular chaperone GrpE (heat shock protein)
MNNENPETDLPENDDPENNAQKNDNDQHPLSVADKSDDGDINDDTLVDDDFEIGISIHETLVPPSGEEPALALHAESLDINVEAEDKADALNGEPVPEAISIDDSQPLPLSAEMPVPEVFSELSEAPSDPKEQRDLLEAIKLQIESLAQAFDTKLKYDDHKNKIIDELHQTLQQHREGLLKKYLHRIVMDVIKVVDDMRKLTNHYNQQPDGDETSIKLIKYIENIASDLEDMFSWEGVAPFTCDGDTVDPARQRILNKVPTDDATKDKTIAERLRPGYEWDGKIIRPEMVSVYIYQTDSPSGD